MFWVMRTRLQVFHFKSIPQEPCFSASDATVLFSPTRTLHQHFYKSSRTVCPLLMFGGISASYCYLDKDQAAFLRRPEQPDPQQAALQGARHGIKMRWNWRPDWSHNSEEQHFCTNSATFAGIVPSGPAFLHHQEQVKSYEVRISRGT